MPTVAAPPRRPDVAHALGRTVGGLGVAVAAVWAGLRLEPSPLPPPPVAPGPVATVPLPDALPAPVTRFLSALYGDRLPVIRSAVISGRGTMRIGGMTFPARWRFTHLTGTAYRHHIQLTFAGRPVMSVDEWYLDQHARLDLPFGSSEGPAVDQAANLGLWAEAVWMPAVWATDDRVRWEPVDDTTARLVVPFGEDEESFTVTFDPDSGLLRQMTSLRFKGEHDTDRTPWINDAIDWGAVDGHAAPLRTAVAWGDERGPWARLRTEEVRYNADVDAYVRASGP